MIPKIIHYCWFGRNPKPALANKCIKSWKKYCKDYQIIEWNEDNFDISSAPLYVRQAYQEKKWAYVTDYVRLKVIYDHGGIYLDTDVELIKPLDCFLNYHSYFGFEDNENINTGLGFGAEKNLPFLSEIMSQYDYIPFILEDGSYDKTNCPKRNTEVFLTHGLVQDGSMQVLDNNITVFPSEYFCPISWTTGKKIITQNTVSIHWFDASWRTKKDKKNFNRVLRQQRFTNLRHNIVHFPNRIMIGVLGKERYEKLKKRIKGL